MDDIEKQRASVSRAKSLHRSISRNLSKAGWGTDSVFSSSLRRTTSTASEDEEGLKWAAIEKLPTYNRLRTNILKSFPANNELQDGNKETVLKEVDVSRLDVNARTMFIDRLFKVAEEDNERFLRRVRHRIDD